MAVYNNPNVQRLARIVRPEPEVKPSAKAAPPSGSARSDSVALSFESKVLAVVKRELEQTPLVRSEKVEALKKAIAEGTYRVSAEAIAQAMLDEGKVP